MNVIKFENERWSRDNQKVFFRHRAAIDLVAGSAEERHPQVLDIGCGDGLLLSLLEKKGIAGKGLDISQKAVEKCRSKGLDCSVFEPGSPFPYASHTFDVVTILDVLEHVYEPQELLKECARVSKGKVIIGVPNFSSLPARLQVLLGKVPENNRPNKGHVYWFNHSVLRNICTSCGLEIKVLKVNAFMENRFLIGRISKWLAKTWPSMFALSFVIDAQKKEAA